MREISQIEYEKMSFTERKAYENKLKEARKVQQEQREIAEREYHKYPSGWRRKAGSARTPKPDKSLPAVRAYVRRHYPRYAQRNMLEYCKDVSRRLSQGEIEYYFDESAAGLSNALREDMIARKIPNPPEFRKVG